MKKSMLVLVSAVGIAALSGVSWGGGAPDGKPVFLKYKCNSCHSISAAAIADRKSVV